MIWQMFLAKPVVGVVEKRIGVVQAFRAVVLG